MDYKNPTVSIIVINFNGLNHLKNCIPSLLKQNYPKDLIEIIVVDNGSKDQSVSYLQKNYPEIKIIKNKKNEGFAKPNNQAALIANGEYLALINNDMFAKNDWLEQLVSTKKRTEADCIAGIILNWDGNKIDFVNAGMDQFGNPFQVDYNESIEKLEEYNEEKELLFACGGAMLVNKEVYLKAGGFDEDFFAYYEDVDFGWRLRILGYKVIRSPQAICYHRHQGTSSKFHKNKRGYHMGINSLLMVYKNYDDNNYLKFLVGSLLIGFARLTEMVEIDLYSLHFSNPSTKNHTNTILPNFKRKLLLLSKMNRIRLILTIVSGFVIQLPKFKEKRKKIQNNRVRSDIDIKQGVIGLYKHFKKDEYITYFVDVFSKWDI